MIKDVSSKVPTTKAVPKQTAPSSREDFRDSFNGTEGKEHIVYNTFALPLYI